MYADRSSLQLFPLLVKSDETLRVAFLKSGSVTILANLSGGILFFFFFFENFQKFRRNVHAL
jgi:hypothetical protein